MNKLSLVDLKLLQHHHNQFMIGRFRKPWLSYVIFKNTKELSDLGVEAKMNIRELSSGVFEIELGYVDNLGRESLSTLQDQIVLTSGISFERMVVGQLIGKVQLVETKVKFNKIYGSV